MGKSTVEDRNWRTDDATINTETQCQNNNLQYSGEFLANSRLLKPCTCPNESIQFYVLR